MSLVYVHGHDFREGIRHIRSLTDGPIGMNVLTEKSSDRYLERMQQWLEIALEEGVRFFVSSLGNPRWIVDTVGPSRRARLPRCHRAQVGRQGDAGRGSRSHRGQRPRRRPRRLAFTGRAPRRDRRASICPSSAPAGIGDAAAYRHALELGYVGVQIGTRLIATTECTESAGYKQAIIDADEDDIVLTHKITGVPVSVIRTEMVEREGTEAGRFEHWLLTHPRVKHWVRAFYSIRSVVRLKRANQRGVVSHRDYLQAGKSVAGIGRRRTGGRDHRASGRRERRAA